MTFMEPGGLPTSLSCWTRVGCSHLARPKSWIASRTTDYCRNLYRSDSHMKNHNLAVGIFITAAAVVFTAGLFLIGNRYKAFSHRVIFYTDFQDVEGLDKGAQVRVEGMNAGEVENVQIPSSPAQRFRLKTSTMRGLNGVVQDVRSGKGSVGMLLEDKSTAADVRQSVSNIRQTTEALRGSATRVDN